MKIGIICDINYSFHPLFRSYYMAVRNIFGIVKIVKTVVDLEGLETLFIGDDHFAPNKDVWQLPGFIDYCNQYKIKVIVFTNERIVDSFFPWNVDNLNILNKFKYLYHYTADADDGEKLKTSINRMSMSKLLYSHVEDTPKKNKVIFIGHTGGKSYTERRDTLNKIKLIISIDIFEPKIPDWWDYMKIISNYQFVLSPVGNANEFPMRFYEALAVNSIPIQQVRSNTLQYYDLESKFDDCIFYEKVEELPEKIKNCKFQTSHNMIWMEDNIRICLGKDGLL
jgi:hypothetical protein